MEDIKKFVNQLMENIDKPYVSLQEEQNAFKRLLIKTPLEPYTQELWRAFKAVANGDVEIINDIERMNESLRDTISQELDTAKALLALFKKEPVKVGRLPINNYKALWAMRDVFMEDYRYWDLDKRHLTFEEAQDELMNWENDEYVKSWLLSESNQADIEDLDLLVKDPFYINYWAELNLKTEIVSLEQIEKVIAAKTLELNNIKRGRKPQNDKLSWLIVEIRKYYKDKGNYLYRLIFDCMDFFSLIDSNVKSEWKIKNEKDLNVAKTQYIKAVYNNALKFEGKNYTKIRANVKGTPVDFHDSVL